MLRHDVLNRDFQLRLIFYNYCKICRLPARIDSIPIAPHLPQTPASSFKSLYRKRANTPCSCVQFAHSHFRYNTKTYRALTSRIPRLSLLFITLLLSGSRLGSSARAESPDAEAAADAVGVSFLYSALA